VLEVGVTLAACKQVPHLIAERIGALKSSVHLELNAEICQALLEESSEELTALRTALGS
jgi:hypothetical protein